MLALCLVAKTCNYFILQLRHNTIEGTARHQYSLHNFAIAKRVVKPKVAYVVSEGGGRSEICTGLLVLTCNQNCIVDTNADANAVKTVCHFKQEYHVTLDLQF